MNAHERMNRAYIDSKLAQIFEPMVNEIFQNKPEEYVTKINSN